MLTIVTTCKGRLSYLKQSLPTMIGTGLPVVVVDYDCPDGTRHYVEEHFAGVKVVAIEGKDNFNLAQARNLGAAEVTTDFIGFFDCDVLIGETFLDELRGIALAEDSFYVAGNCDLHGQCIVAKSAFDEVGGYDEAIAGWGGEDGDFYYRLQAIGCLRQALAPGVVSTLGHTDHERIKYTGGGDLLQSHRQNVAYAMMRRDIERLTPGGPLHLDERRKLRDLVIEGFAAAKKSGRPYVIEWQLPRELDDVDYLLDGTTGYSLGRVMRYEISRVPPSLPIRLLSAIREGRILSAIRRRIRALLSRRAVNSPNSGP